MREEKIGWKTHIGIVLACLLVGLMFEGFVSADRGMIPTSDVSVYGPGQKAIIAWNGEEELLILSTDVYTSESSPVLGILPLPSNPKAIKEGNFDSFTQIESLIRNKARFGPGINITFHEKIGAHDITVVEVKNDVHEFIQWAENYLKVVSVTTGARPNSPPTNGILVPTRGEPQPAGTSITWVAYAEDPDGDPLYYRFWIKGPSTGYSWTIMQDWNTDNTWTWQTSSADIGNTDISVWIRDGHHAPPDRFDLEKKYYDYNIAETVICKVQITSDPSLQDHPSLLYANGNYYIAYLSKETSYPGLEHGRDIFIKKFDSNWNLIKKVQVTSETSYQDRPSQIYANGYFYVAYFSKETGNYDIFVKRMDANLNLDS